MPRISTCVVEPGVTRKQLNDHLRDQGLFFPIDPGADATLGGMAATRASGTNAVRYGTMRDNVINLTAVMADGAVVKTGNRAKKSSAGYDLARLLIGSEGTLGIITELTLRLHGIPEAIAGGVVPFPTVEGACNATILTIQSGIPGRPHRAARRADGPGHQPLRQARPAGDADAVRRVPRQRRFGRRSSRKPSARSRASAAAANSPGRRRPEERTRLWQARHDAYWAAFTLRPGAKAVATDVCVPISRLAECVTETIADVEASRLIAPIVGHVGDGNFHLTMLVDMDDRDEVARCRGADPPAQPARHRHGRHLHRRARHRPGQDEIPRAASTGSGLDVMRAIKRAIDPQGIMNPGKIFRRTDRRASDRSGGDAEQALPDRRGRHRHRAVRGADRAVVRQLERLPGDVRGAGDPHPRPSGARRRRRQAPSILPSPSLTFTDVGVGDDRRPADDDGRALRGRHRADAAPPGRDPRRLDEAGQAGGARRGRCRRHARLAEAAPGRARRSTPTRSSSTTSRSRTARSPMPTRGRHRARLRAASTAQVEARSLLGPWRVDGSYLDDGQPVPFRIATGRGSTTAPSASRPTSARRAGR